MWRRCFSLSLSLLAGCAIAQSKPVNALVHSKAFLIGAEWSNEASPAVKALFWETGCNFARLTGGGYGWTVERHRQALDELDRHGVKVLLQLGSHYPDSRFFEFKDAYFVDQNGKTGIPSKQSWAVEYDGQSWPQYSYASTTFRDELEKDFAAYFKALGPLKNVDALLLHNEPGLFWLDKRIFDYSPSSIAYFRRWLSSQYSSVANLNQRWGTAYRSFDQVDPPRDLSSMGIASWMDWRRSNIAIIADFLGWEGAFAHRLQTGRPITTNLSGPIDNWFPIRLGDNFRLTERMDIASIDIYPGSEWTSRFFPGYTMDMTRGAARNRPIYVAECESYAESHFPKLNDTQRAERLTSDLWSYIGHGANAISIWTLNGQDGFRLTNGEFNARIGALREVAHTAKMLELGEFVKPQRNVALVIDQDSYLLAKDGSDLRSHAGNVDRTVLGMYCALALAHIELDVVSADMVRSGLCDHYKSLVLASADPMDAELAQHLAKYVEMGGLLISDASLASVDRWGKACLTRPSYGLDQVFGVRVTSCDTGKPASVLVDKTSFPGISQFKLSLIGAEPIGRFSDGGIAVTHHRQGKGHAVLLATDAGTANNSSTETGLSHTLEKWLRNYGGISPAIRLINNNGFIDAMRLKDKRGNELTVLTNPPNQADTCKPHENVQVVEAKPLGTSQSFLIDGALQSNGRSQNGPKLFDGQSWIIPSLVSHAIILSAHDHSPLLSTDSPQVVRSGSLITIRGTLFNPSPKSISGHLDLVIPAGWTTGKASAFAAGPFGQQKFMLTATVGPVTRRVMLKVAASCFSVRTESIPFDIEVIGHP